MQLLLSALEPRGRRAACTSTSATSASIARSRAPPGSTRTGEGNDSELFDALRDKDFPAVHELTGALPEPARDALRALAALVRARRRDASPPRARAAARCRRSRRRSTRVADARRAATGVDAIHVDLADLRGYHYYTGATFSVFAHGDARRGRRLRTRRPLRRRGPRVRPRAARHRLLAGPAAARGAGRRRRCARRDRRARRPRPGIGQARSTACARRARRSSSRCPARRRDGARPGGCWFSASGEWRVVTR